MRAKLLRLGKRVGKLILSPMLDATGMFDRKLDRVLADGTAWTILTYHRVIDDPGLDPFGLGMCVRRTRFESQMEFLARRFSIATVSEVVARLERGEALPPRTLSITIDDGYLDNTQIAFPTLRARGIPASLFVVTGDLTAPRAFWWDRVINAFDATGRRGHVDPAELGLPPGPPLSVEPLSRPDSLDRVLACLWTLEHEAVLDAVRRIETALEPPRDADAFAPRMDDAAVRRVADLGFEIGAHSVRHPNLTRLEPEALERELGESRASLERLLGRTVTGFAYPAGHMDDAVAAAARRAGFSYALSTVCGVNAPGADRFALRRIGGPDATLPDFKRAFTRAMRGAVGPGGYVHEGPRPGS